MNPMLPDVGLKDYLGGRYAQRSDGHAPGDMRNPTVLETGERVLSLVNFQLEAVGPEPVVDENIGLAGFVNGASNLPQTQDVGGVDLTIVGDQPGAIISSRVDGVMLPDGDMTTALGVDVTPTVYTLTFSRAVKGLIIEARDFVNLAGRIRKMVGFNIAPQSVTGALVLDSGEVSGSENGADGTLVFDPEAEITVLTFTVTGTGTNGLKGPRLRNFSFQEVFDDTPVTLQGFFKTIDGGDPALYHEGVEVTGNYTVIQ